MIFRSIPILRASSIFCYVISATRHFEILSHSEKILSLLSEAPLGQQVCTCSFRQSLSIYHRQRPRARLGWRGRCSRWAWAASSKWSPWMRPQRPSSPTTCWPRWARWRPTWSPTSWARCPAPRSRPRSPRPPTGDPPSARSDPRYRPHSPRRYLPNVA